MEAPGVLPQYIGADNPAWDYDPDTNNFPTAYIYYPDTPYNPAWDYDPDTIYFPAVHIYCPDTPYNPTWSVSSGTNTFPEWRLAECEANSPDRPENIY